MLTAAEAEALGPPPSPPKPDLSVIIPAVNGIEILLECLEALDLNSRNGLALEVLVIERTGEAARGMLARRATTAVVIPVGAGVTIPQMRAIGLERARADAIAVIEDHVLVPADWAHRLLDALAAGADVVGGSVHNVATRSTVDWAAFLCDYSHLLSPPAGRNVDRLAGNNVVYRRALVARYRALLNEGRWEDDFHTSLRRDGIALTSMPEISVGHKMHYRMQEYLSQRYLYSRAFAGTSAAGLTFVRRAWLAVRSVALPPVLLVRIVMRVLVSRRHRAELVRSLPLLVMCVCAWAAGEVVGYAAGPGDALARVR